MLYPRESITREIKETSGFWQYRFDYDEVGNDRNWQKGFASEGDMPVPGSWNELFPDEKRFNFFGTCWYQKRVLVPDSWRDRKVWLRVGAVSYRAAVYVNGKKVGQYDGGHMPFEFAIEKHLHFGAENLIVIAVNAILSKHTLPVGNLGDTTAGHSTLMQSHPDVNFDFFPYGGIHRPVQLYTTPKQYIAGLVVNTDIRGSRGVVDVKVDVKCNKADAIELKFAGQVKKVIISDKSAAAKITIDNAMFWSPKSPYLYDLEITLLQDGKEIDQYKQPVGIRTIKVKGKQLLLNGEPLYLRGFGKHEDFAAIGKSLNHAVIKKDFELLKWVGANSFRTTHYPYAEEWLDMADREGFLVISETAAVGMSFEYESKQQKKAHYRAAAELIARDRNHPSVIMWCAANEPRSDKKTAGPYFKDLIAEMKKVDDTRPVTVVTCDGPWVARGECSVMQHCDVICINRYYGWYAGAGRVEKSIAAMSDELDEIYRKYRRPIMVTEFGADCVAGQHALPAFVFSEEYQAELIEHSIKLMESKEYFIGEHIWNFADFMTGQVHTRVVGNKKGIFTRDRQPKLAAHTVKRLWAGKR